MKNTKRLLLAVLSLAMLATCIFAMSSCDKIPFFNKEDEHVHAYNDTVTAPTCTEQGYTTHTCECGDSYVDTYVDPAHAIVSNPAKAATCTEAGNAAYETCSRCDYTTYAAIPATGHNYEAVTTKLPAIGETGVRTYTCKNCNHSYTEDIEAISVSLPSVSETLASMFNDGTYKVELSEGSSLILVKELDDYTVQNGYKNFLTVDLAEAVLDIEGSVAEGHLKLDFGVASVALDGTLDADVIPAPTNFAPLSLHLYVNGDSVSLEITQNGASNTTEVNLSEVFYTAVAETLGMSYDQFLEVAFTCQTIGSYLPLAAQVVEHFENTVLPETPSENAVSLLSVLSMLGDEIVSVNTDANNNTVYTLDIDALADLVAELDGKTVGEFLDAQWGEGMADSLVAYLTAIPDMKVKDIANAVIAMAETYELDINHLYVVINSLVSEACGVEFDIEAEIASHYEMTLAEVVAELQGVPAEQVSEVAATLKTTISTVLTTVKNSDVDQLYNLCVYGDANYTDENGNAVTFVSDTLNTVINILSESVEVEITVDANGAVTSVGISFSEVIITEEGNLESEEILGATYTVTEDGFTVSGVADGLVFNAALNAEGFTALVKDSVNDLLNVAVVTDENGVVTGSTVTISGYDTVYSVYYDEESGEYIESSETVYVEYAEITYTNDNNGNHSLVIDADGDVLSVDVVSTATALQVTVKANGNQVILVNAALDENGNVTSLVVDLDTFTTHNEYDTEGNLTSSTVTFTDIFNLVYANDGTTVNLAVDINAELYSYNDSYDATTDEYNFTETESVEKVLDLDVTSTSTSLNITLDINKVNSESILNESEDGSFESSHTETIADALDLAVAYVDNGDGTHTAVVTINGTTYAVGVTTSDTGFTGNLEITSGTDVLGSATLNYTEEATTVDASIVTGGKTVVIDVDYNVNGFTALIKADEDTLLDVSFTNEGVKVIVNTLVGEYDEETEETVYTLENALTYQVSVDDNGVHTEYVYVDGFGYTVVTTPTETGCKWDVYADMYDSLVLADAAFEVATSSTETGSSLTFTFDINELLYDMGDNEYYDAENDLLSYIGYICTLMAEGSITFSYEA